MTTQTADFQAFAVASAQAALAAFANKQAPTAGSYLPDFRKIASKVIEMGGYVVPVDLPGTTYKDRVLNGKECVLPGWQQKATRDPAQIEAWYTENPHRNCAIVGKAEIGALWGFDDDCGLVEEYESQHGMIPTYRVRTVSGHTTLVFKHNEESIALGNLSLKNGNNEELFSCRIDNRYIMSAGSIAHPDNDLSKPAAAYIALDKERSPIAASSDFLQTLRQKAAAKSAPTSVPKQSAPVTSDQPFQSNAPEWVRNCKAKDGDFDAVLDIVPVVHEGGRNDNLMSMLGKLHQIGWTNDNVYAVADRINSEKLVPPLSETEYKRTAQSACSYEVKLTGPATVQMSQTEATQAAAEAAKKAVADKDAPLIAFMLATYPNMKPEQAARQAARIRVQAVEPEPEPQAKSVDTLDRIPTDVLDCSTRLSDIYLDVFEPNDWPLVLALPALVTAASVVVPPQPRSEGVLLVGDDPMVNLYTALIAEVGVGKSQIIKWAARAVGIMPEDETLGQFYYEAKWGSGEQLLKAVQKKQSNFVNKTALLVADELSHLFAKASIDKASLPTVLDTAFYKRHHNFTLSGTNGGSEYNLNLAVSLIGGVVEAEFDTVFGADTLGGLYDRFLFARAPEKFKWDFRPCPIISNKQWSTWGMTAVSQDGSVFEVTKGWKKQNPDLGRISELCVKVATIFASLDGRKTLTGADMEKIEPLARYQVGLRQMFAPNGGKNPDAIYANKALAWVNKNATEWRLYSDLQRALQRTEEELGPNAAIRSLAALARQGHITLWLKENNTNKDDSVNLPSDYIGRTPNVGLVRRVISKG